jgi:thioredoxin reductase
MRRSNQDQAIKEKVENFFGFPTGISGGELTYSAQLQAYRFGAKFSTPAQALSLAFTDGEHRASLQIEGCNATLLAKCVIIATGADYHRLEAEGRETFEGSAFTTLPQRAKGNSAAARPWSLPAAATRRARPRCFSPKVRRKCCW